MSTPLVHANWARTLRKARRLADWLRSLGFHVIEPAHADLPPSERPLSDDSARRSGDHGLS